MIRAGSRNHGNSHATDIPRGLSRARPSQAALGWHRLARDAMCIVCHDAPGRSAARRAHARNNTSTARTMNASQPTVNMTVRALNLEKPLM
jgi:hypothetical protein